MIGQPASRRTALVTGASRGIGAAIAASLEAAGLQVLAPTRRELDLLSDASIDAYLAGLHEPVDVLVNNAGINRLGKAATFLDEDLQDTLQTNLVGPLRLIRGLVPGMVARRYGHIVNISSLWSLVSKAGRVAYSASKAALNGVTRTLAVELAPYGILVNAVAPGFVNTELTRQNNTPEDLEAIRRAIPLQRLAEPEEIARAVLFLVSEQNTYITGQVLVVDGGYSCL